MKLSKEEAMAATAIAERGTSVRRPAGQFRGDAGSAAVPAEDAGGGVGQRRENGSAHSLDG